jgi:Leucine-rich repeat (LRR) protein
LLLIFLIIFIANDAQEVNQHARCWWSAAGIHGLACQLTTAYIVSENYPITFNNSDHLQGFDDSHVQQLLALIFPVRFEGVISVISKQFIDHFPNLSRVGISLASVERITSDAFSRCANIVEINVNSNNIQGLSNGLFSNCINLRLLDVRVNQITAYNSETFAGLENLETLRIGMNPVTNLPEDSFKYVGNLRELELSEMPLYDLPRNLLANLDQLRTFLCTHCELSFLHSENFLNQFHLNLLDLSNNQLRNLPTGVFRNQMNLRTLHLSNNQLFRIGSDSFGSHPILTQIWNANSTVDALDPRFANFFPSLQLFDFRGNLCIDLALDNVTIFDFNANPVFNRCFSNW